MADISKIQTIDGSIHDIKDATGRSMMIRDNMLDNWYFIGGGSQQGGQQFPINSRGQTSYTGQNNYSIDRWWIVQNACTVSLESDGIRLTRSSAYYYHLIETLNHILPQLRGKQVTISVLWSGTYVRLDLKDESPRGFAEILNNAPGQVLSYHLDSATAVVPSDITTLYCAFYTAVGANTKIHAVKLELGDTQTLCHNEGTDANPVWVLNEIPNYEEQLIRCKSVMEPSDTYANDPVVFKSALDNKVNIVAPFNLTSANMNNYTYPLNAEVWVESSVGAGLTGWATLIVTGQSWVSLEQLLIQSNKIAKRKCENGSWGAWSTSNFADSAFASGVGYVRHPDGTMMQWGIVTQNVTYSAWGNAYESSLITLGDFPIPFVGEVPIVQTTLNNSGSACLGVGGASPTLTGMGHTRTYRPNDPGTASVTVAWLAIGRWKT